MFSLTIAALSVVWLRFWIRFQDPFHPAILLLPMFMFLYGYMPIQLIEADPEQFASYSGGDAVYWYQTVTVTLIACLVFGISVSTWGLTRRKAKWTRLTFVNPRRVTLIALFLGLAGLTAWLAMIMNVGGFAAAYGSSYGGGWISSGYIREMRYIGLIGVLLIYTARTGKGMRGIDWFIVAICIAPTLIHAILGARRGPLFLAVIVLGGGYIYFMRKRISLPMLIAAGIALGLAMLFLVANRGNIHLGATLDPTTFRDPTDFVVRWASNEFLIGGSVVQYTDENGSFYGRRELSWLVGRILPGFIWPTVWTDLPQLLGLDISLRINGGVSQEGLTTIANWTPSVGSAEGFTGSLYLEFGILSPLAAFLIGYAYGRVWSAAKNKLPARVFYLLMIAMSVYLVMQALDPWLYRLILFGIPTYFAVRFIRVVPERRDEHSVHTTSEHYGRRRGLRPMVQRQF